MRESIPRWLPSAPISYEGILPIICGHISISIMRALIAKSAFTAFMPDFYVFILWSMDHINYDLI